MKKGRPGVVIEIDETKLETKKYSRRHLLDGMWIIAGVKKNTHKN